MLGESPVVGETALRHLHQGACLALRCADKGRGRIGGELDVGARFS